MKVAFVSGPYRAETIYQVKRNIQMAERVAIEAWERGYAVICPHKNTAFFDGRCPDRVWLDGCLAMIRRLDPDMGDCLVMAPGWGKSEGSLQEFSLAQDMGLPIVDVETQWMIDWRI